MQWVYHLYGTLVVCNFPLARLQAHQAVFPHKQQIFCTKEKFVIDDEQEIIPLNEESEPMFVGRIGRDILLRFYGVGEFYLRPTGDVIHIICHVSEENTLEHLLLDAVLPIVASFVGKIAVHAGGVQIGKKAILLCGESGVGKSTLTTYLAMQGHPFLADDCVVIDNINNKLTAYPSYPASRLWEQSASHLLERSDELLTVAHYSTKKRAPLDECFPMFQLCEQTGIPLSTTYFLSRNDEQIAFERITKPEAFRMLQNQTFTSSLKGTEEVAKQFMMLTKLINEIPIFHFRYPRNFTRLAEVHQALITHQTEEA